MEEQHRYSFDAVSRHQIWKGMMYAVIPAIALAILSYFQAVDWNNPIMMAIATWIVPSLINAIKEWRKGISPKSIGGAE